MSNMEYDIETRSILLEQGLWWSNISDVGYGLQI